MFFIPKGKGIRFAGLQQPLHVNPFLLEISMRTFVLICALAGLLAHHLNNTAAWSVTALIWWLLWLSVGRK